MIPLQIAGVCLATAVVVAALAGAWPAMARISAILGLCGAAALAGLTSLSGTLPIGGVQVVDQGWVRTWTTIAALALAALELVILLAGRRLVASSPSTSAAALGAVAASVVALNVDSTAVGVLLLSAAALMAVAMGTRGEIAAAFRLVAVAGGLAVLAALVPPARTPAELAALGLMTVALALRLGIVPFHVPALRLAVASPLGAAPIQVAWLPAPLALVALAWSVGLPTLSGTLPGSSFAAIPEPVPYLVAVVAGATIVLAAVALLLQSDLGRLVAAAGVAAVAPALLVAVGGPVPADVMRRSLLLAGAATGGLAAWSICVAVASGERRLAASRGWLRRVPLAGVTLVATVAGTVGWPGTPGWEARSTIVTSTVSGPLATVIVVASIAAALAPLRVLWVGAARPDSMAAVSRRRRLLVSLAALAPASLPLLVCLVAVPLS